MRPLMIALALALCVTPAAAGDVKVFGRIGIAGDGFRAQGSVGTTPVPPLNPPLSRPRPPVTDKLDRGRSKLRDGDDEDGEPPRRRPRRDPFLFFDDDDDDERIIVVPAPPPPRPVEPEPEAAEPPPPPDPRGPSFQPARGLATAEPYAIGEPLPEGVPFVSLDWRQYGLPEPPAGLIYARVGRDVLLIEPVSRVVRRRVDPAELREDAG